MEVYHDTVTPAVTFNPYLPAIGRVLEALTRMAPIGTTIETTNRDLAALADLRSASQIPTILRKLEIDRYIERITTAHGSLIVVSERSIMIDRSEASLESDQLFDRSQERSTENERDPFVLPDRSCERSIGRSDMIDPPHTPHKVIHAAAADSAAAESRGGMQGGGVSDRSPFRSSVALLLSELGCDDRALRAKILEKHPDLTPAQLSEQWTVAQQRERDGYTDNARRLLFGTLGKGGTLYGRVAPPDRGVTASDIPPLDERDIPPPPSDRPELAELAALATPPPRPPPGSVPLAPAYTPKWRGRR